MDVDRYLARIGIARPAGPSLEALADLQLAHLLAVPFENLDIIAGVPISLELAAIFDKTVVRRRGGFCYELNGLFATLLAEIGYRVTLLSARTVDGDDGTLGPEYDHLVLRVDLDEPWLIDVGFGDSIRVPMPLRPGIVDDPLGRRYRLRVEGDDWTMGELLADTERPEPAEAPPTGDGWRDTFRFTLAPRSLAEFHATCRWQETESPWFTGHRICSLATSDGRISLVDDRLIVTTDGTRTEHQVHEIDVPAILRDRFGVVL